MKNRIITLLFFALVVTGLNAATTTTMWYEHPAEKWMEALPVGNGRLSAMVYGGINTETIALNEISLWSGRHDSTSNDLCGRENLDKMRAAFFADDPEEGNRLGNEYLNGRMTTFGTHLPLGNLKLTFTHPSQQIRGYQRALDLSKAIASTDYSAGNIQYHREFIADYPDAILAMRITASQPGSVNVTTSLDLLRTADVKASGNDLYFEGKADFPLHGPGGVNFCGNVRLLPQGGTVTAKDGAVSVEGADALTIIVDVRTDYADNNYKQTCMSNIQEAQEKGWNTLLNNHIADYTTLFGRMSIDLGGDADNGLPTDTRLRLTRQGVEDPGLDALFFQYGRYMLISSSRPNGTPLCANLQGIWNDNGACNMPWTCDYHMDVNTAQNYWSANRANLDECNDPLFSYLTFLAEHGKDTASKMYGCNGWVAHTVCNAWGYTAPGWGVTWGMNVTGGAWLATHIWSHYLYTRDDKFLRSTGYPIIREAARFFKDYMTTDPRNGYLVTGPSISPENGYISPKGNHLALDMMPTIDRVIVHDIYNSCIEASKILNVDKKLRRQLEKDIKRLPPIKVGSDGLVQEWLGDVRRSDPSHRHSSHLLSLFPLNQITVEKTPELVEAARRILESQTASPDWEDTEWSTANMMCMFARMKDGETAYGWLQNLFRTFTRENLMTVSPAGVAMAEYDIFSFDATEASVAGICEMLLHSYDGTLDLLPALPSAWESGTVKGLRAEGGLTVDLAWEKGQLTRAEITADRDCSFALKGHDEKIRLKKGNKHVIEM